MCDCPMESFGGSLSVLPCCNVTSRKQRAWLSGQPLHPRPRCDWANAGFLCRVPRIFSALGVHGASRQLCCPVAECSGTAALGPRWQVHNAGQRFLPTCSAAEGGHCDDKHKLAPILNGTSCFWSHRRGTGMPAKELGLVRDTLMRHLGSSFAVGAAATTQPRRDPREEGRQAGPLSPLLSQL